jgi:hypothetical protein
MADERGLLTRDSGPGGAGVVGDENVCGAHGLHTYENARGARACLGTRCVEHNPADAERVAVVTWWGDALSEQS